MDSSVNEHMISEWEVFYADYDSKTLATDKKKKWEKKLKTIIRTKLTGFIHWQTGLNSRLTGLIRRRIKPVRRQI